MPEPVEEDKIERCIFVNEASDYFEVNKAEDNSGIEVEVYPEVFEPLDGEDMNEECSEMLHLQLVQPFHGSNWTNVTANSTEKKHYRNIFLQWKIDLADLEPCKSTKLRLTTGAKSVVNSTEITSFSDGSICRSDNDDEEEEDEEADNDGPIVIRLDSEAKAEYVNTGDRFNFTVAYWAAFFGSVKVMAGLNEAGANLDTPAGIEGRTPLMVAANAGMVEVVDFLINNVTGINITAWDVENKTAQDLAMENDHIPVILTFFESDEN